MKVAQKIKKAPHHFVARIRNMLRRKPIARTLTTMYEKRFGKSSLDVAIKDQYRLEEVTCQCKASIVPSAEDTKALESASSEERYLQKWLQTGDQNLPSSL